MIRVVNGVEVTMTDAEVTALAADRATEAAKDSRTTVEKIREAFLLLPLDRRLARYDLITQGLVSLQQGDYEITTALVVGFTPVNAAETTFINTVKTILGIA
jgi:hypothetical protein